MEQQRKIADEREARRSLADAAGGAIKTVGASAWHRWAVAERLADKLGAAGAEDAAGNDERRWLSRRLRADDLPR